MNLTPGTEQRVFWHFCNSLMMLTFFASQIFLLQCVSASWSNHIDPPLVDDEPMNTAEDGTLTRLLSSFHLDFSYSSDDEGGCITTNNTQNSEIDLTCFGRNITDLYALPLPTENLKSIVTVLTIKDALIKRIPKDFLQPFKENLRSVNYFRLLELLFIEDGLFRGLKRLQNIYIRMCPHLIQVPDNIFHVQLPQLRLLRFTHTALEKLPKLDKLETNQIIHMLDFESNKIKRLQGRSIKIQAYKVLFQNNKIKEVEDFTFKESAIAELYLNGNNDLTTIGSKAFSGLEVLRMLDLSDTKITSLPTDGLQNIETLRLQHTYSLHSFPSVYKFKYIQKAHLTYPYHCCAFRFPAKHDPREYENQLKFKEEQDRRCGNKEQKLTADTNGNLKYDTSIVLGKSRFVRRRRRDWGSIKPQITDKDAEAKHDEINEEEKLRLITSNYSRPPDLGWRFTESISKTGFKPISVISKKKGNSTSLSENFEESKFAPDMSGTQEGVFHNLWPNERSNRTLEAICGDISKNYRDVTCEPEPDAFNPCEDIMGNLGLRIAVWFVVVAAVLGNFIVIIVLLSSRFKMTVSKFLMCNLACADFFMGTYLLIIATMDLHTIGAYFNHAIDWQHGTGCQIAGFITVFASELSIFTLTVITLERWFAITYAINLNKRIRLKGAAKAMLIGWVYALTMATLPVLGISGYARTSICLPMANEDTADLVYLITVLSINGLAFILICACYGKMYVSITAQHCFVTQNDKTVAKRMALLVFTDFACWAPIAFFGLTAIAGHPFIDVTRSKILLVFFYPLNSCANPFLYAILTKQYRRDFFILLSRYGFCTNRAMKYKTTFSYLAAQRQMTGSGCNSVNTNRSSVNTQVTLYDMNRTFKGMDSPGKSNRLSNSQMLPDLGTLYGHKGSKRQSASGRFSENSRQGLEKSRGSPHPLKSTAVVLDNGECDTLSCLLNDSQSPRKKAMDRKDIFIFKSNKKSSQKPKQRHRNVVELKL